MKVAVICTGNICRSPIGEILLREAIADIPDMAQRVEVTSAGTANWHIGKQMDARAAAALQRAGLPTDATLGAFASAELLREFGLVLVMTREHRTDVLARHPQADVLLVRELLGHGSMDVADPYYGRDEDFDDCLSMLREVTPLVVRELQLRLTDPAV